MRAHFREGHLEKKERRNVPRGCDAFQMQRWSLRYSSGEQFWSSNVRANTGLCRMTHTSVETLHTSPSFLAGQRFGVACLLHACPEVTHKPPRLHYHSTSSIFLCRRRNADRRKPQTAPTPYGIVPGPQPGSNKKIPKVNGSQKTHQRRRTMNHSFTAGP